MLQPTNPATVSRRGRRRLCLRVGLRTLLLATSQTGRALQQVDSFLQRERWPEVVAGLQQLVEGQAGTEDSPPGDTFSRGTQGQWTSLQRLAQERIAKLPPAGARLYQQVYGPVASDQLAEARQSGELSRLANVAGRFLNTPSGEAAALEVGLAYFDRGDYLACLRWLERLPAESLRKTPPLVQVKYALALWGTGRQTEAEQVADRFTGQALPAILRGTEATTLPEWWQATSRPAPVSPSPQMDWPGFYGNATHSGVARAGSPLLLEEWMLPLTYIPTVQKQVESLTADLRDAGRACIPAAYPILVGERLAVRSLRGVDVIDLGTGRLVWSQSWDESSPDRILSGTIDGTGERRNRRQQIATQAQYTDAGDYDQHPLTSLLYRDAVTHSLSSDGRRLFALTHHSVLGRANYGFWIGNQEQEADPYGRNWSSNVITAYNLESGAELWQVGGRRTGEPFERPLSGTFFFGAPTVADDELYVIGEQDNQVCLFVLDRHTGKPVFTQMLANAQTRVDIDSSRRLWNCQPAISEGVIVCPTTTGWTIAIDRLERRLLWAHNCEPPIRDPQQRQLGGGVPVQPLQPLNVRWEPTPPIIVGRHVLITPPELPDAFHSQEPLLICLDLATGHELWRKPKQDDGLYVGGVRDGFVLVVGKGQLQGLELASGIERWSLTLPTAAPPSGRGVMAGEDYLLPLADGQLWVVRAKTGKVADRLKLPDQSVPLGNLTMTRGRLVSVDPLQVRSFSEATVLEAEIARRQAANANDLWAALRQAQIHLMRGDRHAAVSVLQPLRSAFASADPELAAPIQNLLRECLLTLVGEDLQGRDLEFEWLLELADVETDGEARRLAVERGLARNDGPAAWKLLWPAPTLTGPDPLVAIDRREVRTSAWEVGRLATLYAQSTDELRSTMDAAFESAIAGTGTTPPSTEVLERLESLLEFHPAGRQLTVSLAEAAEARNDFAAAEIRWRRLWISEEGPSACTAGLRLASWLARNELTREAEQLLVEVSAVIAALPEADRAAAEAAYARLCEERQLTPTDRSVALPGWADIDLEARVMRRQPNDQSPLDVLVSPGREAFYESHRMQFLPQSQRLRISAASGRELWSLPLRSPTRQMFDQTVGLRTDGLQAYAVWQGVVQALSLPDRKVRWTHPIDLRSSGGNYVRNVQSEENLVLLPTDQFASQWGLSRYRAPTGMVAAANPGYVLLHGRRAVSLVDSLTGEVRWVREGVPPRTMVHADGERVYGLPSDGGDPFVVSALDGREIDAAPLAKLWPNAIGLRHGVLTVMEPSSGLSLFGLMTPKSRLRGVDAVTGADLWSHDVDRRTRIGWLSDEELVLMNPQGRLEALDVQHGKTRVLGQLPADTGRDGAPVELLTDARHLFLLFDREWRRKSDYVTLPHAQINGAIACFARDGSGFLWRRKIVEQRLILPHFRQSPVLTFFNQMGEGQLQQLRIVLWDKATGQPLLESDDLMVSPQTYQLECDLVKQRIRFIGHTLQVEVGPRPVPPQDLPADATRRE